MDIRNVPIGDIRPYDANPRRNEDAVKGVAESLTEFGWQQPIVVNPDMVILAGHTRYLAAKQLGMQTVPVTVAEGLTEEEETAYRLADNKTGELSEWDVPLMNYEINTLKDEEPDLDMTRFGFSLMQEKTEDDDGETVSGTTDSDPDIVICPRCKKPFSRREGRHLA